MELTINEMTRNSIRDLTAPPPAGRALKDHLIGFSTALCGIMNAQYHAIVLFPGKLNPEILLSSNNTPEFESAYYDRLQECDFILQELMEHPHDVVHLKDLLKKREHRESFFFKEAQRIRPAGDCLYAAIHLEDQVVGFFGVVRAIEDEDFTDEDKNLIQMLSPVLSCHIQIYRERMSGSINQNGSHYDFGKIREMFQLTKRELEILDLIFRGLTNRQISEELNIQESTVKRHISNTFEKTGSRNRTQLIFNTALN